jgi:hypothetical protein
MADTTASPSRSSVLLEKHRLRAELRPSIAAPVARLTVRHCCTRLGDPLTEVDGLPGGGAELTPAQLRGLAAALLRAAADSESLHPGYAHRMLCVRSYAIGTATRQEVCDAL